MVQGTCKPENPNKRIRWTSFRKNERTLDWFVYPNNFTLKNKKINIICVHKGHLSLTNNRRMNDVIILLQQRTSLLISQRNYVRMLPQNLKAKFLEHFLVSIFIEFFCLLHKHVQKGFRQSYTIFAYCIAFKVYRPL